MPKPKAGDPKTRGSTPTPRRVQKKADRTQAATDTEAFYAAQQEAAVDSREYAARRRQRRS